MEDVAIIAFATRVPSACEKVARKLGIEIYADETVYRVMELFREGQEKLRYEKSCIAMECCMSFSTFSSGVREPGLFVAVRHAIVLNSFVVLILSSM